jgi:DNA-binding MarR family transcriptional regulator
MSARLQAELKQKKSFGSLEEVVYLNVLLTAERLMRGEVDALKAADLSFAQYNVLRILRGAGSEGLSCREISERMIHRDPDITRLLDRLEARGQISRSRVETDRRVIIARITDEGLSILAGLDEPINEIHRKQLKHLSRGQLKALSDLLELARNPVG